VADVFLSYSRLDREFALRLHAALVARGKDVAKGTHLFALAVDRWRSAVVGLYEAMSSGAERLPGSPDPERWPWALAVKPLSAISPPDAIRIDGFYGPQNGLPTVIPDEEILSTLYNAIADSPPPPGPRTSSRRSSCSRPMMLSTMFSRR
jgi:hypothetical protein